ncbi:alkaline phosphatase PhoX [Spongiactinospora rosea]|nr:alkaline phosphatase PhoX [Spongiactinospora rosea]
MWRQVPMLRRTFARTGPWTARALDGSLWRAAAAGGSAPGEEGPYGPLRSPDRDGLALPAGFDGRVIARTGQPVGGLRWHAAPDGGACVPDGEGWIYVSNSAVPLLGGASAIRFRPDGSVRDAYRILSGATLNRAGCATPWRTWLSGEGTVLGRIFECDPYGVRAAMPRLAMGRFKHQALACDADRGVVYLTEDEDDGCLYRFRPVDWGELIEGELQVLCHAPGTAPGRVAWRPVPSPASLFTPARHQVPEAVRFARPGGCHYADGVLALTTTGDGQVWAYDATAERLHVVYDGGRLLTDPPHRDRDLYTAEDGHTLEISVVTPESPAPGPLLRLTGQDRSKITGLAFSPTGHRLYFSTRPTLARRPTRSLTAITGTTYEITGPFRP